MRRFVLICCLACTVCVLGRFANAQDDATAATQQDSAKAPEPPIHY
jgi:hypothetical protein